MDKIDYTKLSDKELNEKLEELGMRKILASNHKFINPKEKPENYSKFRKEIARIQTELRRRNGKG